MKPFVLIIIILNLSACDNSNSELETVDSETQEIQSETPDYLSKPIKGIVSQRGLYRLLRSDGLVNDDRTSTVKTIANPVIELVQSGERIPLIKGAQMHLQYRIWPLADQPAYVDLRRVLKHPTMQLPDAKVSTGSDYLMKGRVSVNQIIGYTGYGFDEDYELLEGDWTFQIWYQDRLVIEQVFITYHPDEAERKELEAKFQISK